MANLAKRSIAALYSAIKGSAAPLAAALVLAATPGCEKNEEIPSYVAQSDDGGDTITNTSSGDTTPDSPVHEPNGTGSSSSQEDDDTDTDEGTTAGGDTDDADDEEDTDATTTSTWYADDDGDGYGDASDSTESATQPSGYVSNASDCDDTDASASPADSEGSTADGVDNDCDGTADDGIVSTSTVTICVVDSYGDFDLYVLNQDNEGGDEYWIDGGGEVFLTELDADGCVEFEAGSGDRLKFNGFGDSDFWGSYLVGACDGTEDSALLEEDGICSAVEITVDGDTVGENSSEWEEYNLLYSVP